MPSEVTLLRTSERTSFKRCRWAWDRAYNDLMKPKTAAPPLRFGTLVHRSMEAFYLPGIKRGPRPAKTFAKLYKEELKEQSRIGYRDEDGKWADAGEMGVDMLEHYYDVYGKDNRWYVVATEQPFQVPVYRASDLRKARRMGVPVSQIAEPYFYYVGVLDGIWRDRGTPRKDLWLADHKTTATDPTQVGYLALDEQAGAYWTYGVEWLYAEGLLQPDQRLQGILFNFMRKAKRDTRPTNAEGLHLNDDGQVSKRQPTPYFHREPVYRDEVDRQRLRTRVRQEVKDMVDVRSGKSAAYKNPSKPNCTGCGYRDICELHETGADWETMARGTMDTWDPYAEHELYDAR